MSDAKQTIIDFGKDLEKQAEYYDDILKRAKIIEAVNILTQIMYNENNVIELLQFVAFGIYLERNKEKLSDVEIPEIFKIAFDKENNATEL